MILELFVVLVALALVFIALGLYSDELKVLGIVGCLFIFLLGVYIILPNNLEIRSGSNVTYNGLTTSIDYKYVVYNDDTTHYVGYFLSIVGLFGILFVPLVKIKEED